MTILDRPQAHEHGATAHIDHTETVRVLAVAIGVGVAVGVGDLWARDNLGLPWSYLANTSVAWALSAFVLGALLRTDPVRAAVAGALMLCVAVEAYYLSGPAFGFHHLASPTSLHARAWLVVAVAAGVVFGVAGAWSTGPVLWRRALGLTIGASAVLGEGVVAVAATALALLRSEMGA